MLLREAVEAGGDHTLVFVSRFDPASHEADEVVDGHVAEHFTSDVAHVRRGTGHALAAPLRHQAGGETSINEVGLKVSHHRIGFGAGAELVHALPMAQEGSNADPHRLDRSTDVLDARSVRGEPVRPREDKHTLGRYDDRMGQPVVFMAQGKELRTELESNAGEITG